MGLLAEAKVPFFSALKSRLFVDGIGWISGGWWINKGGSGHTASLLSSRQYSHILSKRYLLRSRENPDAGTRGNLFTSDGEDPGCNLLCQSCIALIATHYRIV